MMWLILRSLSFSSFFALLRPVLLHSIVLVIFAAGRSTTEGSSVFTVPDFPNTVCDKASLTLIPTIFTILFDQFSRMGSTQSCSALAKSGVIDALFLLFCFRIGFILRPVSIWLRAFCNGSFSYSDRLMIRGLVYFLSLMIHKHCTRRKLHTAYILQYRFVFCFLIYTPDKIQLSQKLPCVDVVRFVFIASQTFCTNI